MRDIIFAVLFFGGLVVGLGALVLRAPATVRDNGSEPKRGGEPLPEPGEGTAGGDAETVTVLYASLLRRFQAVVADSVVYVAVGFLAIVLGTAAASIAPIGGMFLILWVGFLLLYEPVSVSRFGGTLGHRFNNLRVASNQTGGNVSFGAAVLRFLIKAIFGWLSFALILLTRRRQALHDLWTLSTVQIRDAEAAEQHHFVAVEETLPNAAEPAGEEKNGAA